jgi:N-acetylgalactosamine kinase
MSTIPVYGSVKDVYADQRVAEEEGRYAKLVASFAELHGAKPDLLARSPGRVNLIGEHIDYEGYSVLPMALAVDTIVAVKVDTTSNKLTVSNTEEKYTTKVFDADCDQAVDVASFHWTNYVVCGYKGVFDFLKESGRAKPPEVGLKIIVDGKVPTGSGLSSSSALTCAAAVAVMAALNLDFTKTEVADFACKCERHCGMQSGGMDQAISIMGQSGVAKLVDFNPVRATDVQLPEGSVFLIGNCLAVSNKAVTAHERYNLRVMECRLASIVLAMELGASQADALGYSTLMQTQKLIGSLQESEKAASEKLHDGYYSRGELEEKLGTSLDSLFAGSPASLLVLEHNKTGFKLRDRSMHVYSEAARVHQFSNECKEDPSLKALGELMNASHTSCRDLYECSCEELDELVDAFITSGAIGARLTGAGGGGCAVALVTADMAEKVLESVKTRFFDKRIASGVLREEDLGETLFASLPSSGAAILRGL